MSCNELDSNLIRACKDRHLNNIKTLLERGADIHANNDDALKWASENGHVEVVKILLENGADVHAVNDLALRWASYNGQVEVVKVLLENGADVHACNDGALRGASENGYVEVVKMLKEWTKKAPILQNKIEVKKTKATAVKNNQESTTKEKEKDIMEKTSKGIVQQVKASAMIMKDKAVHGAEVAVSVAAKELLVEQVKALVGKHFPKTFYATPLGKALLDAAACYFVHVAACTYPSLPGSEMAAKAAELAMEGVSRDSFAPLLEVGKKLIGDVSSQFNLSGLVK